VIELAIVLRCHPDEIRRLDDRDLATLIESLDGLAG